MPATVSALAPLRLGLAEFARTLDLPDDLDYAFVLSTYEAMANVAEHAYTAAGPGTFDLRVVHDPQAGTLTATLVDHGTWGQSDPEPKDRRGRGLQLIRACSDQVEILRGEHGSHVHLQWHLRHTMHRHTPDAPPCRGRSEGRKPLSCNAIGH